MADGSNVTGNGLLYFDVKILSTRQNDDQRLQDILLLPEWLTDEFAKASCHDVADTFGSGRLWQSVIQSKDGGAWWYAVACRRRRRCRNWG